MSSYRAIVAIVLVTVLVVGGIQAQELPTCFLSMGDWGHNNPHVTSMSSHMQQAIEDPQSWGCSSINMTLALGDNFYSKGVASVTDPQWEHVFVSQFRAHKAFKNMPVYAMMGDHDYAATSHTVQPNFTRAQAQVDYHYQVDPLWVMPAPNYTFTMDLANGAGKMKVIVMNTEALYACLHTEWCFDPDHPEWIESELRKSDNDTTIKSVIIVGHHAVVCPYGGHYDPKLDSVLVPIARRHRVSLIMTGHSHFIAWSQEEDISGGGFDGPNGELWYIINGAGRGAGAYHCWWHGLHMPHAKPKNKLCMPYGVNQQGAFMLHRAHPTHFEHCVIDSMNGTLLRCQRAPYREVGGSWSPASPTPPFHPGVPPTPLPPRPDSTPMPEAPPGPQPPTPAGPPGRDCSPQCSRDECNVERCPPGAPYVCTAGRTRGGCSPEPWRIDENCMSCCDSSNCIHHRLKRLG